MAHRDKTHSDQLTLDFGATAELFSSNDIQSSVNVVYIEDHIRACSEAKKEEILSLFSEYASKLKW